MASPVIDNKRPHEEIAETMSGANQTLSAKLGRAISQLRKNRDQFAKYEKSHREKNTADGAIKADTNKALVDENNALLNDLTA